MKPDKKKKYLKKEKDKYENTLKTRGYFLKPFDSFFQPRAMEPPLTQKEVDKLEGKIQKEVENVIRQVRSNKNLNAFLHKTM